MVTFYRARVDYYRLDDVGIPPRPGLYIRGSAEQPGDAEVKVFIPDDRLLADNPATAAATWDSLLVEHGYERTHGWAHASGRLSETTVMRRNAPGTSRRLFPVPPTNW